MFAGVILFKITGADTALEQNTVIEHPVTPPLPEASEEENSQKENNGVVDINIAIHEELLALPGIGAAEAGLILKRTQSGQTFSSLDELAEYLALKPHKIAHLHGKIRFSSAGEGKSTTIPRHGRVIDMGYEEDSPAPRYGRVID